MPEAAKSNVRGRYVILAVASALPPSVHYLVLDSPLERLRSPSGLMPGLFLFVRGLAQVWCIAPLDVLLLLLLSFGFPALNTERALAGTATGLFVALVFYTAYIIWVLSAVTTVYT